MTVVINVAYWIFWAIGILGVISFIFAVPAGIIFFIISSSKEYPERQKLNKWGTVLIVSPFVMIIGSLFFLILLNFISGMQAI